jgi:hypothetical protein
VKKFIIDIHPFNLYNGFNQYLAEARMIFGARAETLADNVFSTKPLTYDWRLFDLEGRGQESCGVRPNGK